MNNLQGRVFTRQPTAAVLNHHATRQALAPQVAAKNKTGGNTFQGKPTLIVKRAFGRGRIM